ncbi:MAG: hypothetical protein PHV05_01735 [Candidatus Riflebacteria bacterium]|nr:hypothetical protein [Candidatus Riflebacteria bacterium]
MKSWKDIKINNIRIEMVVATYEVWAVNKVPFGKFKVKILERSDGNFIAIANIRLKDALNGEPEGEAGLGNRPEEALQDVIERLLAAIESRKGLTDDDFEWSAPEDF